MAQRLFTLNATPLVHREKPLEEGVDTAEYAWLGKNLQNISPLLKKATESCSHLIPFVAAVPIDYRDYKAKNPRYLAVADRSKPSARLFPYESDNRVFDYLLLHRKLIVDPLLPRVNIKTGEVEDKHLLEKLPPPNTTKFLHVLYQVFDAVNTLHNIYFIDIEGKIRKSTLIHHDLGLHNTAIRYDRSGEAHIYIYDYELARLEGSQTPYNVRPMGHRAYAPLEQCSRETPAAKTEDIAALGFLICDLFVVRDFATGSTIKNSRIASEIAASDWEDFAANFSPELSLVLQKATASDPENRYPTTEVFWEKLQEAWENLYNKEHLQMPMFSSEAYRMFLIRYKAARDRIKNSQSTV